MDTKYKFLSHIAYSDNIWYTLLATNTEYARKERIHMAEKKERQIIDVNSGTTTTQKRAKKKSPAAKKTATEAKVTKKAIITPENRKKAVKFRWGAAILWLLAIGAEVLTILVFNKTIYIPGNILTYILIGLGIDLALVIAGSLLWKKSNRLDPASEKNKVKFFLWNNMGLLAAIVCFVPLIILLLKEKDLDPKVKKIASIVAIIVAVIASAVSIDWTPVSAEDLAQAQSDAEAYTIDGNVFWTQFGKCYHLNEDCGSLKNSAKLYKGTVDQAFEANREKPCSFCASAEALEEYAKQSENDFDLGVDVSDSDLLDYVGDIFESDADLAA